MSQHDYVIANASGATVRADLNSLFQAMLSQNSGTSEPSTTSAGMFWLDTTGGAPYTLKIRDAGNNHWLTVFSVPDPGSDGTVEPIASGTKMLFNQTSAPTGWTKDTSSNNNSALRVVTGTAGTGGTVDFTTAFASQTPSQSGSASVSNHTLAESEIPSHRHGISVTMSTGGHTGGQVVASSGSTVNSKQTGYTGGAGGHSHSMTQATYNAINLAVKYVDVIVATKD